METLILATDVTQHSDFMKKLNVSHVTIVTAMLCCYSKLYSMTGFKNNGEWISHVHGIVCVNYNRGVLMTFLDL